MRYLVLCAQGFGDALEATPMIAELRKQRPDATIDVVVTQGAPKLLFESLPELVNSVIYLPLWEKGRRQFVLHLLAKRWREKYDFSILCYPAARAEYHLLTWAFPSRRRIAHRYGRVTLPSLLWLHTDLQDLAASHNVLRNMDLLLPLDIDAPTPTGYVVPGSWKSRPEERRPNSIVFHVGTVAHHGREGRRWPLEFFGKLASLLLDSGYEVDIIAGPSELPESEYARSLAPDARIFQGSLPEVGRLLSSAALVVTNDNGIGHLASGVGARVVSLFGPTPLEHAPFGSTSFPIRLSECPPCFDVRNLYSKCELGIDYRCLKLDMPPGRVFSEIQRILSQDQADARFAPLSSGAQ
jgi:heptosyltransferase-2